MLKARGIPSIIGRKDRFIRRTAISALAPGVTRKRAFLTPSRLRKRIVLSISSNWIAAAPNAVGDVRRKRAWFSTNVKPREKSCRTIREHVEDAGEESIGVFDMVST